MSTGWAGWRSRCPRRSSNERCIVLQRVDAPVRSRKSLTANNRPRVSFRRERVEPRNPAGDRPTLSEGIPPRADHSFRMRGARHRRTATLIFLSSLRAVNYLRPNAPCALIERCAGSEFPNTFWSGRGRKSSAIGWCLLPWRPRSWNAGAPCMADPKATRGEGDRGAARPERSESTARENRLASGFYTNLVSFWL